MANPRSQRQRVNEYFLPEEGISREVIQADICRYLGNDALVRPATHQGRRGYLIRAYRNLTTEMISDLKADSARWEAEASRRQHAGYAPVSYTSSQIHEVRQQMGPTSQQQQHSPSGHPGQPDYGHPGYSMPEQQYQHPQQQQGVTDNPGTYAYSGGRYLPTPSAPEYYSNNYAYEDSRQGQTMTYDPQYSQQDYSLFQTQPAGMPGQQAYVDPRDPRYTQSSGYSTSHGQSITPGGVPYTSSRSNERRNLASVPEFGTPASSQPDYTTTYGYATIPATAGPKSQSGYSDTYNVASTDSGYQSRSSSTGRPRDPHRDSRRRK